LSDEIIYMAIAHEVRRMLLLRIHPKQQSCQ